MWKKYFSPVSTEEVLQLLTKYGKKARLIAGGTDLIIEIEKGQTSPDAIIDITRIIGLDSINQDPDGRIHVGPLVTHNQVVASDLCISEAVPLVAACGQIGSPQIRNRGTIAGNLITGSPANDTITPLWTMDATLTLQSLRGTRGLSFDEFYRGVRQTELAADEMLTKVSFPSMKENQRGIFLKSGLRKAQAISVINIAVLLTFDGEVIAKARISLGCVAPTIFRAIEAEKAIEGQKLNKEVILHAAKLAAESAIPIDDIRAPADYRRHLIKVFTERALHQLSKKSYRDKKLLEKTQLWGCTDGHFPANLSKSVYHDINRQMPIETMVNGNAYSVLDANHKTVLRMLREDIGLTGTKEGCGEGECGACTVWMDGIAVNSCMIPAPRAHKSEIVTIEGLANGSLLHPVQKAFIEGGAVQCGYCSPGFIMAAASLLETNPHPNRDMIRHGLSGCLCRCTGYQKIISAVEEASRDASR